jgi:UPF0755 protein
MIEELRDDKNDVNVPLVGQVPADNVGEDALGLGRLRKRVPIFLFIILIPFVAAYFLLAAPSNFAGPTVFHIAPGETLSGIAQDLREQGLVRSAEAFRIAFTLIYGEAQVKAGAYYLDTPLTVPALAKRIASGVYSETRIRVLIPEGFTTRDIAEYFAKLGAFSAEDFMGVVGEPARDYRKTKTSAPDFDKVSEVARLKSDYLGMEGYLFPDTYFFYMPLDARMVAETMAENMDRRFTLELRAKAAAAGRSVLEILTMASILEKEAATPEDRRIISGILWKRIKIGMALQVDASLGYITGKPSSLLTESDLKIDSPYNTYKYAGLPLGPIANPGLDAIVAATLPQTSPYLYYLSDKSGAMHYAKTFEEHKANKQKYLR